MCFNITWFPRFLLLLSILFLASCGGGGSTPASGNGGTVALTYSIAGTVTFNGAGLPGVSVSLAGTSNATTTTTGSGSYSFTGLANGNYTVTPSFAGYSFNPVNVAVNVNGASLTGKNFAALAVPANVTAVARDSNNLISWNAIGGATTYNIYWSTTSSVNKTNGTKIALSNNPQVHTGLANGTTYYYVVTAVSGGVEGAESVQASATPVAATAAADPLYPDQWHLKNTGQKGANQLAGLSGEDLDVEPAWAMTDSAVNLIKGNGVRIAVVDDGLEIGHPDLAANIAPTGTSYNYVTLSADPTNDPTDKLSGHGTAVAGIVAARDLNGIGVRGVAPRANLLGLNLLQNDNVSNEADAMIHGLKNVEIYTNSWGPPDGYGTLDAPDTTWRTAIDNGLTTGRSGLGAIYTWAAGNGGRYIPPYDNSNFDGYANFRGVIAVAAVNDQGKQATYSEPGANLWISAPGGEFCDTHAISTTDRSGTVGENPPDPAWGYSDYSNTNYTKCMNGTSSAAPEVAGIIALMLQANPNLGWRDVRLILAQSARKNDSLDAGWAVTGGTPVYHFNHKYGFGVADASAAVSLASTWTNVGPQVNNMPPLSSPNLAIPDATGSLQNPVPGAAVSSTITVSNSNISSIELVEITFSAANHTYSGDLTITLTSPQGTVSTLAQTHLCYPTCTPYNGWVFNSAANLGELADGIWTLTVQDGGYQDTGTFQSWKLKFYGR